MRIRDEEPGDHGSVDALLRVAFGGPAEAELVEALRAEARPLVSLVAEAGGEVVGHILFSPARLRERPDLALFGLAPMAVAPARQRTGIGGALVREGLARCRGLGAAAVVVLGHPAYYPRFGFVAAQTLGLRCVFDAPPGAFQALELVPGALRNAAGTVRYHDAFARF